MPIITANGLTFAYDDEGAGFPVILVHGSVTDRRAWRRQLPVVRERYRAIAYDRRGHGESDHPDYDWMHSVNVEALDLLALMDALELPRAVLVGSSYGGLVAFDTARRAPERVAALVLTEPPMLTALTLDPWAKYMYNSATAYCEETRRIAVEGDPDGALDYFLVGLLGPDYRAQLTPSAWESIQAERASMLPELDAAQGYRITDLMLKRMETPTLLMQGADSPRFLQDTCVILGQRLPNVEYLVVPDAGHLVHLSRPDVFNEKLMEFLSRHVPAAER